MVCFYISSCLIKYSTPWIYGSEHLLVKKKVEQIVDIYLTLKYLDSLIRSQTITTLKVYLNPNIK